MNIVSTISATDQPVRDAIDPSAPRGRIVIVIPTLNEALHIVTVIRSLRAGAQRLGATIVVVDGGSTDGTVELARAEAVCQPDVVVLNNPRRLQAAAINLAVAHFDNRVDWIIRADAHAGYPEDYCNTLLQEAHRTGADSVVVRMRAVGSSFLQRNIMAAQNAFFGNGGSLHRSGSEGRFVDHGHHALMRVGAFLAVGGYDETFSHNEDAELDQRLIKAGLRIWLTGATEIDYYPRDGFIPLARQYYRFGAGRCATAIKHPGSIRKRHFILIGLAPVAFICAFWMLSPVVLAPFALWLAACLLAGAVTAMRQRQTELVMSGLPAAVMQMAWSFGFWSCLLRKGTDRLGTLFKRSQTRRAVMGDER